MDKLEDLFKEKPAAKNEDNIYSIFLNKKAP